MSYYLKIIDNNIVEAPYNIVKGDQNIFGYNKESNEAMLFEDGYVKFNKPIDNYTIVSGNIVEKSSIEPISEQTVFNKLQIRRAMRALGIEDILNTILENNTQFRNDWNDAVEIDLNDEIIQGLISQGILTQEALEIVRATMLNGGVVPVQEPEPQIEEPEEIFPSGEVDLTSSPSGEI